MDKTFTYIIIGGLFYGFGVAAIKLLGPLFWDTAFMRFVFIALNFAVAALTLPVFARMTGRTKHDMLVPTVIMALAAMIMDGLTLSFVPTLYAIEPQHQAYAGGLLLTAFWGFFFFALLWHRPKDA